MSQQSEKAVILNPIVGPEPITGATVELKDAPCRRVWHQSGVIPRLRFMHVCHVNKTIGL